MRIHSIDHGRGVMSLSILFYHLHAWTVGTPESETLLGKLGVYGVSVFFVISGMSMYISYKSTSWTAASTFSFFLRRFFRLAPVYWIALSLTIGYTYLESKPLNFNSAEVWSNALLTFGITDYSRYIVTGGWSIGNEVVFYIFFPLLIAVAPFKKIFLTVNVLIMYVYVYYGFIVMDSSHNLGPQWAAYINPANQAFLFSSGVCIAWAVYSFGFIKNHINAWAILIASIVIFVMYPVSGDQISIVSEWNRVYITALIIIACYALINIKVNPDNLISRFLSFLGDVSYPVYLLHGVLFAITNRYVLPFIDLKTQNSRLAFYVFIFTPVILSVSWLVFMYIEKPLILMAKKVTKIDRREPISAIRGKNGDML